MILPYLLRLLCLSFASFFLLNAVASQLVQLFSKLAVRRAERKTARVAARLLLALRLLPFAIATLFVIALCVPSYLWLEPSATTEQVGVLCVIFGMLGAATWLLSVARAARVLVRSYRHNRQLACEGLEAPLQGRASAIVVNRAAPILAMSGLFRPRLLISRSILQALSSDELAVALSHEQAHRLSRDNAKRLLLLLAPDVVPFVRPFRQVEAEWSKLAEWAADDHAVQGDSLRAAVLASALVRVARIGAAPMLPELSTSLLACERDLSARVTRLLMTAPVTHRRARRPPLSRLRSSCLFAVSIAFLLLAPMLLSSVHELLERFLH